VRGVPPEFEPVYYSWIISAVWGLVLGLTFWRYDFLTCFTGFFVAFLMWDLNEGWLVDASPAELDVWLGGIFVLGLLVFGGRGILSGETRRAATEYVPAYISELKQQERLRSEIDIARQVQASFLPRKMPDVPGLDIAAMCLAAHEVGGDYYDFIALGPGRLAVVVGDVSGKGTQAAFFMTLTKGIIQTLSREDLSPADVMRRFNTLFYENAPRGTFISMIYGVFDVEKRHFTFARAGHNPVILKRSPSQDSDLVQPTGLAIGLVSGPQFDNLIEERTVDLRIGDVLVFYTDGFSEAMNGTKDQYGDDRLARKVSSVGQRSATEILHAVAEDVHHFVEAAGRHDDMTMVVVKLDRTAAFASLSSPREQGVAKA
jgi:serine phosphatase RsbU (regulator of sigma subunit)